MAIFLRKAGKWMVGTCSGCKWHDDFSWVCFNGDSENRADFVNCGCEMYESLGNSKIYESEDEDERQGERKCN